MSRSSWKLQKDRDSLSVPNPLHKTSRLLSELFYSLGYSFNSHHPFLLLSNRSTIHSVHLLQSSSHPYSHVPETFSLSVLHQADSRLGRHRPSHKMVHNSIINFTAYQPFFRGECDPITYIQGKTYLHLSPSLFFRKSGDHQLPKSCPIGMTLRFS